MRTREPAEIAPRPSDHSEDLAVGGNFENAPWIGRLSDEQYLIRAGVMQIDLDAPITLLSFRRVGVTPSVA
jgi:hypothetical protein